MDQQILNNRYHLLEELGQGGMGTVYRGRDEMLNRDVAVKVLTDASLGPERRARLLHEAQTAAGLNHPNIVAIHDVGEFEGLPYIVMELVDGHSLHNYNLDSIAEIIEIARQICIALDYAHAHGVVHRDLKPENVLVGKNGTAKLTDFGLARSITSRLSNEGQLIGTAYYLAPELARGQEFDGRVDLYALGVTLYELTTGELPFTAEDPLAVISQHLHTPVVPPMAKTADIPPGLDALIVQLLAKNPADRPPSAAATLAALDGLEENALDQDLQGEL